MASAEATMAGADTLSIDAAPQAGQNIKHNGQQYTTIKEGFAHILVPHGVPTSTDPKMSKEETQRQQVFYNPIQQFNRDLSVLAIKTFGQDLIQRKTMKHEQQKKKLEKKKQRIKEKKAEGKIYTATADTAEKEEAAGEVHAANANVEQEAPSKKRKLAEDQPDEEAIPAKKPKVADDREVESNEEPEVVQNGSRNLNGAPESWQAPFSILDALSATGLRALRYAHEIPFSTSITANDMSEKAVNSIKINVKHNKLESKIKANTGNAIAFMYSFCGQKGFDVIDLDPYGTAAPFIDAAIQAINDEGLLCVTCTDSAIFASHGYLEKTYSQYGGLPFKGEPCHEGGLRLILHAIASSAGRYGMAIEPLLSLSIDYYVRVFVRVRKSPNDVKLLAGKTMIIYHCENGCGAWSSQFLARNKVTTNKNGDKSFKHGFAQGPSADQHCQHCGFKTHLSGPMYGGPLHNVGFIERVLAQLGEVDREIYPTMDRIEGMLHTAMEEIIFGITTKQEKTNGASKPKLLDPIIPTADPSAIDHHPFFFIPSTVAKVIHCSAPSLAAIRGALRHAGFRVTMSHCKPGSIKTDASWKDIWHIMLEWVRQRAPLKRTLKKETAGYAIMAKARASGHIVQPVEDVPFRELAPESTTVNGEENGDATAQPPAAVSVPVSQPELLTVESYADVNFEVKFDEQLGKDHDRGKYVRYQLAPRENWGPMSRAK